MEQLRLDQQRKGKQPAARLVLFTGEKSTINAIYTMVIRGQTYHKNLTGRATGVSKTLIRLISSNGFSNA